MATMLDQLQEVSEMLRQFMLMDNATLQSAVAEGFQESPPKHVKNLSNEQWASSLLDWCTNTAPLIQQKIKLEPQPHTNVVRILNAEESVIIGTECQIPPDMDES